MSGLDEFKVPEGPLDDHPDPRLAVVLNALDSPGGRGAIQRLEGILGMGGVKPARLRAVAEWVLVWAWQTFDAGSTRRCSQCGEARGAS